MLVVLTTIFHPFTAYHHGKGNSSAVWPTSYPPCLSHFALGPETKVPFQDLKSWSLRLQRWKFNQANGGERLYPRIFQVLSPFECREWLIKHIFDNSSAISLNLVISFENV
jgi:hypothetical protein